MSKDDVRRDALEKLIDRNSPLRITKKQILNEHNPELFDYIKPSCPMLKYKLKKEM